MYFDWRVEGKEMKWLLDTKKGVKSHKQIYKNIHFKLDIYKCYFYI